MSYQKRLNIPEDIIKKFCTIGTAHKEEDFQYWFNYTCRELRSASETVTDGSGDHNGCVAVTTHLQREHRQDDIPKFLELSRKLQANPVLGRKDALLTFIVRTCEEKKKHDTSLSRHQMSRTNNSSFNQSSSSTNMASTLSKSSLSQCNDAGQRTTGSVLNRDATEAGNQSRRVSAAETVISSSRVTGVREGNVSELAVLQDLLFAFQGIGGETFRDYSGNGDFRVSTKIPPPLWRHAAYLAELGTLHVRVLSMVDSVPLVGAPSCPTALVTAMRLQLNEFCRLIAQLEAQLHQDGGSQLSMLRVRAMTSTSQTQMKWLATVADVCKDKKGGALLTALHSLMQHGDPKVQAWLEPLLAAASRPFYEMLAHWLKEGHIDDPYSEFFVSVDSGADLDNFWHHRFSIRESMRPSFISKTQAATILATGKSVAFLQELCKKTAEPLKWQGLDAALNSTSRANANTLWAMDGELQACIEAAHKEVSRRALSVMLDEGKLSVHLMALRRYLLLGQGDFVKQLMENIAPILSQPSPSIFTHQLTPHLDSAIRATNAQYDDPDVLARLDVKLMQMSSGEVGWDSFTLKYNVEGPIAMIFTNEVTTKYLCLFNALWRAKRAEWVLSNLWKRQTTSARILQKIAELTPLLREMLLLVSEMNQLVRQMQYYLLFETVECHWSELQHDVSQAASLDQLINAHDRFLSNVMQRALLDRETSDSLMHLRSVFNLVLEVQKLEALLSEKCHKELERRNKQQREAEQLERENKFGTSDEMDAAERLRRKEFRSQLCAITQCLRNIAASHKEMVHKFLVSLASQTNEDLQLLSYRLDFNEHYTESYKNLNEAEVM